MTSFESRLLESLLPWSAAPAWRVAFSGGLDSTVLLHLLASLGRLQRLPPLTAIHVQHDLQAVAAAWPAHCQAVCDGLGVPLRVEPVTVQRSASSLERAARAARYQAFERLLAPAEVLLTAQHRDDQAETLLFRLLRGSGLKGLAGMPRQRALGAGTLLRPLLDVSRAELEAYARAHQLCWVEDPSNSDCHYARNFLRHQVLPLLEQRWSAAGATLARNAEQLAEAQTLLDELAAQDLHAAQAAPEFSWLGLPCLDLAALQKLGDARQRNALRAFLAPLTELPDRAHWAGWLALRDAAVDASPVWRLAQGELRRAGGRVWWLPGDWLPAPSGEIDWLQPDQALPLPGNGVLSFAGEPPAGPLRVRYRQGGERLLVAGRGHRDLKRLLNESGVPSFARARLPLLYRGEELIAVANLPRCSAISQAAWRLLWEPPAGCQGLS
ncbi:tRNA lysidine(34) synthetase TilS [Pseudomonas sp. N040]|uniref:tRNA lysidine(34) synthetase TilS n=1 Tax=Pseudomonas sp. N040 TaxID=2785325 RepID=UPI0018A2E9AE|nr:tRNA lysidine(34) synthetase TilS [Pseudomonas sp. N040]MBF7729716.1 tRNA lysidine(34) synthetase TilS [Pseudomonas sp. N040]MBW7013358.1 tRNA lysidine(34) synthetase TilS [Pseudomonas sp. N040]